MATGRMWLMVRILSLVGTMLVSSGGGYAADHGMRKVLVSEDGTHFSKTGVEGNFIPWGFNYLGKHGSLAEEDWHTPEGWQRIESDFVEMKKLGANVVRWHLQFATFMKDPRTPDPVQLERLRKLLGLARRSGLHLNLTGLNCFHMDRIPAWYDGLPDRERWQAQAVFWSAVAEICADDPAVFCYDLMNEPVIGGAEGKHPWVLGELGGFHFVQKICRDPAGRTSEEIAGQWVSILVDAIRKHDRTTPVTVGVIPWAFAWPQAKPLFYSPRVSPHLDFVSIHVYPKTGSLDKELAALAVYDIGKPLVIEEIFPMNCSLEELDEFIGRSSSTVDGWISHFFGHTVAEHREGAEPGEIAAAFLEYWSAKGKGMTKTRTVPEPPAR